MKRAGKKISRSFSLTLAVIAVMGFFIISLISLQLDIHEKSAQIEETRKAHSELELKNEELESFLASGDDSAYIERIARDVLGYVFPGERVYYDISSGK